jgi:hypothetical protein
MSELGIPWSDVPGHVSYVLIALSYWMTNVFGCASSPSLASCLRSCTSECPAAPCTRALAGTSFFKIINLYQIIRLIADQHRLRYMKELHLLSQGAFASLSREQLAQLVKVGSSRTLEPGAEVAKASQ